MGKHIYKKKEAPDIQGICVKCGDEPQHYKGNGKYRALCSFCHTERYPKTAEYRRKYMRQRREDEEYVEREKGYRQRVGYKKYKKDHCEKCGFVAEETCQLDVDHIDGNSQNNDPSNFQTLCANCHRLKTYLEKNFKKKKVCVTIKDEIK